MTPTIINETLLLAVNHLRHGIDPGNHRLRHWVTQVIRAALLASMWNDQAAMGMHQVRMILRKDAPADSNTLVDIAWRELDELGILGPDREAERVRLVRGILAWLGEFYV